MDLSNIALSTEDQKALFKDLVVLLEQQSLVDNSRTFEENWVLAQNIARHAFPVLDPHLVSGFKYWIYSDPSRTLQQLQWIYDHTEELELTQALTTIFQEHVFDLCPAEAYALCAFRLRQIVLGLTNHLCLQIIKMTYLQVLLLSYKTNKACPTKTP